MQSITLKENYKLNSGSITILVAYIFNFIGRQFYIKIVVP